MYDDIAEETGIPKKELSDLKWVADNVKSSGRQENLSYNHHREVAALPSEKQELFLQKAVDEKLSVRDLRRAIKQSDVEKIALPSGKYQIIYA